MSGARGRRGAPGRVLTHLFLLFFTIATVYPILQIDTIPIELEQAALIDGCGPWSAFTRITLPLAAPALAITALFSFMAAWSEFLVARIVISRQDLYTLPLGLESLAGQFQTEWANYA